MENNYFVTAGGGVFVSRDGGVTWQQSSSGMPAEAEIHALMVDHAHADILYTGTIGGVYYSLDGGSTWQTLNTGAKSISPHLQVSWRND